MKQAVIFITFLKMLPRLTISKTVAMNIIERKKDEKEKFP
jgi:hypothetical protein